MKFKLIESLGHSPEIEKLIQRDCQPFLRESQGEKMYHATKTLYKENYVKDENGNIINGIFKKQVRTDRKPVDSNKIIQEVVDNLFVEHYTGDWRPRSQSKFCIGDYHGLQGYGIVFEMYPIGKFEYMWSPMVRDFYTHVNNVIMGTASMFKISKFYIIIREIISLIFQYPLDRIYEMLNLKELYNIEFERFETWYKDIQKRLQSYKYQEELHQALIKYHEIMIGPAGLEYYLVDYKAL